jgi:aryl-alcohol dehydrogenase-like predicted oxidoreductase
VLTGKYQPGEAPPADSRAASDAMSFAMSRLLDDAILQAVQRVRPVADQAGLSMVEVALAWVLRRDEVASAIVGASRPEQVHANAAASDIELTPDTLAAIDEALGDVMITQPTLGPFAREGVKHR